MKYSSAGEFIGAVRWKLNEIYGFRNFIRAQVTRNLIGRYKNSYLGFLWNFVTPLIYIVLCYIAFVELRGIVMDDFIVFFSSAIFAYTMLVGGITGGGALFTGNSGMIKKMAFPREILALINAISAAVVMVIGYVIVYILALATGHGVNVYAIPSVILILLLVIVFYIGCQLFLGSVSVYVRDVQYLLSSMTIIFFVCTPIRTMFEDATGLVRMVYEINPLTYFVEPLHQALYQNSVPDMWMLLVAAILSFAVFVVGYAVFLRLRRGFVERL